MSVSITLIGGPTALIEIDGFRLLTDPTFDEPGAYQLPHVKLEKLAGPAMSARDVGAIDAVLLSHDQHSDNLDHSGRDFLKQAKRVLTTEAGAKRLGGKTEGFAPWASTELKKGGQSLTITATPARHGPAGIEPLSGDVVGFVVESSKVGSRPIYISGDTTWFDGVAEVARRFKCGVVLPFAGAAQTRGPFHLTMDTNDTIETARAFADAVIVPVHTDGWAHFRQNAGDLRRHLRYAGVWIALADFAAGRGDDHRVAARRVTVSTVACLPRCPRARSRCGTCSRQVRCRCGWTRHGRTQIESEASREQAYRQ